MISDLLLNWVRLAILTSAQLFGGSLGGAILAVSAALRFALLPLTIRLARRAMAQQAILARLQPQLSRLRTRYADQPERLARESLILYREAGFKPFHLSAMIGNLAQLPLVGALFATVRGGLARGARFLWVADLARPDAMLAVLASVVTGVGTYLTLHSGSPTSVRTSIFLITFTIVFVIVTAWYGGGAFALSLAGTGLVNSIQAFFLRRDRKRAA